MRTRRNHATMAADTRKPRSRRGPPSRAPPYGGAFVDLTSLLASPSAGHSRHVIVTAHRDGLVRMTAYQSSPLRRCLIVDENVRLGQERGEAGIDTEFARRLSRIVTSCR